MFCRSTEYLGGCLGSGSAGTIHLTGNEQCVNVYMKGLHDIEVHIKQNSGSVFMPTKV